MKKYAYAILAASLTAAMLLSSCSGKVPESQISTEAGVPFSYPADYTRVPKPEKADFVESTGAGNSGDVKLKSGDTYAVISVRDYGDITIKLYPEEAPYAVQNFIDIALSGAYNGRNFHRIVEDFMIQGGSVNGNGTGGECADGGTFKTQVNTSLRHYYGALCYAATSFGDISDGFYIVNNKNPQTDIMNTYNNVFVYNANNIQEVENTISQITPEIDPDGYYLSYYLNQGNTSLAVATAVQGMYNTTTDAVTQTYEQRGGTPSLDGGYTVFGQTVDGFDVIDRISAVEKTTGSDGSQSKPVTDIIIDKIEIFTMQ